MVANPKEEAVVEIVAVIKTHDHVVIEEDTELEVNLITLKKGVTEVTEETEEVLEVADNMAPKKTVTRKKKIHINTRKMKKLKKNKNRTKTTRWMPLRILNKIMSE